MKKKTIDELNVLVIDDDRHMRMLIRNVLFSLGVTDAIDAGDGKTALEAMKEFKPDLILCDLKMEPVNGMDFVKQLRKDPANPHRFVPIIMITAYAELETVANARDSGVDEFMAKPLSATALEKRIQRVLENPRPFVEAPEFSGPDRRRNKKAAPGGPERRETEPKFLTPSEPLPPTGQDK